MFSLVPNLIQQRGPANGIITQSGTPALEITQKLGDVQTRYHHFKQADTCIMDNIDIVSNAGRYPCCQIKTVIMLQPFLEELTVLKLEKANTSKTKNRMSMLCFSCSNSLLSRTTLHSDLPV